MDIVLTIITSAAVATIVGFGLDVWRESRRNKRTTRHEALSLAILLEGYAISCSNIIDDHDTAQSSDGHAGTYMASIPTPPDLKVTSGFLQIKKGTVADNLMTFSQLIELANQEVNFWWDVVGDQDCARNAARSYSARIGLESISLAKQIRSVFKLPNRNLIFGTHDISKRLDTALHAANL